jgi:hypothetical protein
MGADILVDEKKYVTLKYRRGGRLREERWWWIRKCLVAIGGFIYLHPR